MSRHPNILNANDAVLLIVDVQEAFRKYIPDFPDLVKNSKILIKASKIIGVPILVTEQYSKGLGHTVVELANEYGDAAVFEKNCFSCCGSPEFMTALEKTGRKQIIVAGIEAHVCVNQTVHDLLHHGYQPHLITDSVFSRVQRNKDAGLQKMFQSGAIPSTVEGALFEMLVNSGTDTFKAVQNLIK